MTIAPTVTLQVFAGIGVIGDDFLTLDDPIKGELDEALYPLYDDVGAPAAVDVSGSAYSYTMRRGRNDELDEVSTGTLGVDLRNFNGRFQFDMDGFEPAKRVRLLLDDVVTYDGVIEEWSHSYGPMAGEALASFSAVDAFGELATKVLPDTYVPAVQASGERILSVVGDPNVDFPASRTGGVDTGDSTLQADTIVPGQNALAYAQLVAKSEFGLFFAAKDGTLTMRERSHVLYDAVAAFADDGTGIPFTRMTPIRSTEYLFNRVSVTREGGTEQIVSTPTTQGIRTLTLDGLLLNSDADALSMAQTLLVLYSALAVRVSDLTINLSGITPGQRATCLSLELGDPVSIDWTPPGGSSGVLLDGGGGWLLDEYGLALLADVVPVSFSAYVEGIEIAGSYNSTHAMTLKLSPAAYVPFPFILDDIANGVLDEDAVYY